MFVLSKEKSVRATYEERISCYIVRFETRGKEFTSVARLIFEVGAKAKIPQHRKVQGDSV